MEALAVLIRQQNHIRITRLLRPLFLIDTYYMVGVRRYVHCMVHALCITSPARINLVGMKSKSWGKKIQAI